MKFILTEAGKLANGGTEQQARKVETVISQSGCITTDMNVYVGYIDKSVDTSVPSIYWIHDMPGDPGVHHIIRNQKFDAYVFVSHWQKNMFQLIENLPPSKCRVIPNCIDDPLPYNYEKWFTGKINLIYFSTPHRGLDILVPSFKYLYENYGDKIHLHVASSFALYNQSERDSDYESLFKEIKEHPGMTYHGTLSREKLDELLAASHILAYPNTWPETSCRVLMEAMANGLMCVHPDLAALAETAAKENTLMYPFHENKEKHHAVFQQELDYAIEDSLSTYMVPDIESIQPENVERIRDNFGWKNQTLRQLSLWSEARDCAYVNFKTKDVITLKG